MGRRRLTPWQKIMRAYDDPRGVRGLRLTADDVMLLGGDDAIATKAGNDDLDDDADELVSALRDGLLG